MKEEELQYSLNYQPDKQTHQILSQIKQKPNFQEIINYHKTKFKPTYTKKQIQEKGNTFLKEYFTLQDIIYYQKKIHLFNLNRKLTKIKNTTPISPLEIPITINNKGNESQTISLGRINNTTIITDIIITSGPIAIETYAHEIAHTQQETTYYNEEIIPIFIELLASNYINNQTNQTNFRLNTLYTYLEELYYPDISLKEKAMNIKYIEGTLKAYLLYHLYQTEPLTSKKKQIIDEINQIFKQETTINQIMENHGITTQNYKQLTLESKTL